ncbi:MAG: VOC family protein [Ktedonobacteraceae bacterium]|nr:VOC family protein [Ktedonobacteraceae bacterium]
MERQSISSERPSIHPDTGIGLVTLRVADLERSLRFYEGVLGFQRIESQAGRARLGTLNGTILLDLLEVPGAPSQPLPATGLYHVAILYPTRADLGRALARLVEAGWEIGQGDHLVSEALYVSDPDGNGVELYRDRPRNTWHWHNGTVQMATNRIDLYDLMAEGKRDGQEWKGLPAGTQVGHIHLQVGDIPQAEHFYHDILGFDITAHMPSATFLSAGGYHHHVGANTWQSRGAQPTPETAAGLQTYVIELPNQEALAEVKDRLAKHGVAMQEQDGELNVVDPWQNKIHLKVK